MPRTVVLYESIAITVDCKENDSVDIKCGGPRYLGYDFNVSSEENKDEIKKFINDELMKNNQPILSIHVSKGPEVEKKNIWTREKIAECIKKGY